MREARAIRRKLNCLNPSLQKVQPTPAGKTSATGAGPCRGIVMCLRQSSGAQERCLVRALKEMNGTPKSRLIRTAVVNVGSPKGRESYGDGVPVVIGGVTSAQSGDRESRTTG